MQAPGGELLQFDAADGVGLNNELITVGCSGADIGLRESPVTVRSQETKRINGKDSQDVHGFIFALKSITVSAEREVGLLFSALLIHLLNRWGGGKE